MQTFKLAAKELIRQAARVYAVPVKQIMQLFALAQASPGPSRQNFSVLVAALSGGDATARALRDLVLTYIGQPQIDVKVIGRPFATAQEESRLRFLYDVIDQFFYGNITNFDFEMYPKLSDLFDKPTIPKPVPNVVDATPVTSMGLIQPEPDESVSMFRRDVLKKLRESDPAPELIVVETPSIYVGEGSEVVPETPADAPVRQPLVLPWGKQQLQAFLKVHAWLRTVRKDRKQIFRMFGYAGVGKTAMARSIADFVYNEQGKNNVPRGSVLFTAYTGKASSVLRTKGCLTAQTLHSLIYRPVIDPASGLCTDFVINPESPLSTCALLVVDEASMIPDDMAQDLLSFKCLVLVLGDPAQLPPINGEGYFIAAEPDFMLTDIHRQAKESPVIYLATRARQGKTIKPGRYGSCRVYDSGKHVSDEMYGDHEQVLCGLNATRKTINSRSRRINGKADISAMYPTKGDRLVCLKNNKANGLYNGTTWISSKPEFTKIMQPKSRTSTEMKQGTADVLAMRIRSTDETDAQGNRLIAKTQVSLHHFNENLREPFWRDIAGSDAFDYAYGLTTHKAQGSQYKSVLVYDESASFREHALKHRYTAYTRCEEDLTVLL